MINCGGYLKYIGRVPSGEGGTLAGIHMVSIMTDYLVHHITTVKDSCFDK